MRILLLLLVMIAMSQCTPDQNQWNHVKTIDLENTTPIGLTQLEDHIWISDGDHNQLVKIDTTGTIIESHTGYERPMHLDGENSKLYIPEYGKDQITIYTSDKTDTLAIDYALDAPAGIDVHNGEVGIADFYNHRVLYYNDNTWISIGEKGKSPGQFHYPTDVHLAHDKIYVADAYNNRVQVFDLSGASITTMGEDEKMNATTGIYVSDNEIMVTDFENDRVLIFDLNGQLIQKINTGLDKPTDILVMNSELWIANYKGKNIMVYKK